MRLTDAVTFTMVSFGIFCLSALCRRDKELVEINSIIGVHVPVYQLSILNTGQNKAAGDISGW